MTDESNGGGAPGSEGGANTTPAGTTSPDTNTQTQTEPEKTVSVADHKRALDDMHKYKSEARAAQEKLNANEVEGLKSKEEWKAYSERLETERDKYKTELTDTRTAIVDDRRYSEVRNAAAKAGLISESDLTGLDLANVRVERTDQGRVIVHGVDEYVSDLKKTRPHWFKNSQVPNFNAGGAQGGGAADERLTPAKFAELEHKYKMSGQTEKVNELYARWRKERTQPAVQ